MATLMIYSLYDALKDAGASEVSARKAAEDVVSHRNTIPGVSDEMAAIRRGFVQVRWMTAFALIATLSDTYPDLLPVTLT